MLTSTGVVGVIGGVEVRDHASELAGCGGDTSYATGRSGYFPYTYSVGVKIFQVL